MQIDKNSWEEKKKKLQTFFSEHKGIIFMITGIGIFFLVLFFLSFARLQTKEDVVQNIPAIPITPTLPPTGIPLSTKTQSLQQISLYTLAANTLQQVSVIKPVNNISFQEQLPVLDPAGFVYFIDNNVVYKHSLRDTTQEVVYVNTRLATRIATLTFSAPETLYVGIIINSADRNFSLQPDKNSYIISYNMRTRNLRTIGPLKTITSGFLSYLFDFQGIDVVNIGETAYCKKTGELYSYASASAAITFLSQNGAGCNGRDNYLAGVFPDSGSLLLAKPHNATRPDDFVSRYEKLYTLDVVTRQKKDIFSFARLYESGENIVDMKNQMNKFALSEDKKILYYLFGKQILLLNLEEEQQEKKIMKSIDLSRFAGYTLLTIVNNTAYLVHTFKNEMSSIDLASEAISQISLKNIPSITEKTPLQFLGMWEGEPVFSLNL